MKISEEGKDRAANTVVKTLQWLAVLAVAVGIVGFITFLVLGMTML